MLTRLFHAFIAPIRNEISNLIWKVLSASIFAALAVFFGIRAGEALQVSLRDVQWGPEIEIGAFSTLFIFSIIAMAALLRKPQVKSLPSIDFEKLLLVFLAGIESGAAQRAHEPTNKKEAPLVEPLK